MRLKIYHKTNYSYSKPVFVEPQYLYMYPSFRPHIKLIDYQIEVSPTPSGISIRQDSEGNFYHQCWFNNILEGIQIEMQMEIESQPVNPFDFLVEQKKDRKIIGPLQLYLSNVEKLTKEMNDWLANLKLSTGANIISFFSSLCAEIYSDWQHTLRYEPHILHPVDCYKTKEGSCRDLSWLLIQLLRNIDIPARFVSGYSHNPELAEGHELHAWVEAWLDGSGWIGLDPSSGLFTTDQYIPVAASFSPELTLPVQGSYRGEATSQLDTFVEITELPLVS